MKTDFENNSKMEFLRPSLVVFIILVLLTGICYPLAVTGLGQLLFHDAANGSLVQKNGQIIGSSLIGQSFNRAEYFHSRVSETQDFPYNALASGGSNLAGSNLKLQQRIEDKVTQLQQENSAVDKMIPVDLVTASGSGLDPHISPKAAYYQANRVASARQLPVETIQKLISEHVYVPLSFLGEPVVNVLELNIALDAISQQKR